MANAEKTAAVAEITDAFRGSSAAVLTEYRGLTVTQLQALRRTLAGNATYTVVKNTLTKIAAREAGVAGLDELLEGPSAIAFVTGDPVEVAKGIRDFSRGNPLLVVKGGVLDGRALDADAIRKLADLESREVLLARMAGAMKGSLSKAAGLFAAPLSQVARLAAALQEQVAARGDAPEAAAPEAAVDAAAPEAAVDAVAPEAAADAAGPEATADAAAAEAAAEPAAPAAAGDSAEPPAAPQPSDSAAG